MRSTSTPTSRSRATAYSTSPCECEALKRSHWLPAAASEGFPCSPQMNATFAGVSLKYLPRMERRTERETRKARRSEGKRKCSARECSSGLSAERSEERRVGKEC